MLLYLEIRPVSHICAPLCALLYDKVYFNKINSRFKLVYLGSSGVCTFFHVLFHCTKLPNCLHDHVEFSSLSLYLSIYLFVCVKTVRFFFDFTFSVITDFSNYYRTVHYVLLYCKK
jgi:hypothetical protein